MRSSPFPLERILADLPEGESPVILEDRALELARALGVQVPEHAVVGEAATPREIADAGTALPGDRVVVKLLSPEVVHRTEVGGVRVVPRTVEAVSALLEEWRERFAAAEPRFLLAEYLPPDPAAHELLLGFHLSREFGPVVTVAPGGILAESTAQDLRPGAGTLFLTPGCVARLGPGGVARLLESRGFLAPVVRGVRGRPPLLSTERVVEVVEALSLLAAEGAEVGLTGFEMNPVRVTAHGMVALDALGHAEPGWSRGEAGEATRPHPSPPARHAALEALLHPATLAVAGVSSRGMNPGRVILRNVLAAGFPAEAVQVVKEGAEEVDGVRCVPSVAELDPPVDLLVLGVPAPDVPAMVEEAVEAGAARSLILISGGLEEGLDPGEVTPADRIREALAEAEAPVCAVGSNCLGVRSVPGSYDTLFIPGWKLGFPDRAPAPVALISQSGAFAIARASALGTVNPRYIVTLGTQLDVTVGEVLEHLLDDPEVRTAACYVEGFRPGDGARFLEAADAWVRDGRRVILYRAGRTPAGRDAAASHTASLAGAYPVTRELARVAGVRVAESVEEFHDLLLLSALLEGREGGEGAGFLSNAGFECVALADHAAPLRPAALAGPTVEALAGVLAEGGLEGIVSPRNPLDVTPILGDAGFARAAELLLDDPGVECGVVACVPLTPALQTLPPGEGHPEDLHREGGLASRLVGLWSRTRKPWVVAVDAGPAYDPLRRILLEAGIPVLPTADRAVRALARWVGGSAS